MLKTTFILLISVAFISPNILSTISFTIVELHKLTITFDAQAHASASSFFRCVQTRKVHINPGSN